MNKKLLVSLICTITVLTLSAPMSFAGTARCKVISTDDTTVTMDCGDKASDFDKGMTVKVKAAKKRKAIEGC